MRVLECLGIYKDYHTVLQGGFGHFSKLLGYSLWYRGGLSAQAAASNTHQNDRKDILELHTAEPTEG